MTYVHKLQFTNPIGRARGSEGLDRYGDAIWDAMCFLGSRGDPFTIRDVAAHVEGLALVTATQYTRAFIRYALACPEEFGGPGSKLITMGKGQYRLEDPT